MIRLFLSEPDWNYNGDGDCAKHIISLLSNLESVIWSVIKSGGRSEARLWLCNTISGISSITPRKQCELFVKLLRTKPTKWGLASRLMQMIFERRPNRAGSILAKKSYMLEKFFEGKPRRILQWFSNFAGGGLGHKKGAKALSQFAFVNRDICWEELEWKGQHGQSPAVVATKPHYFLDLDVQRTVENFLENVPEFWSSDEFADSLKDGEILSIDTNFFVDFFVDLMYEEDSRDIWELINEFLMEEPFSSLCHHLLIILEERDFCTFLELLRKDLNYGMETKNYINSSYWLEITITKCSDFESIDQLLLINAVINQGRQLLRLIQDEEWKEEQAKIKDIESQIYTTSGDGHGVALILKECLKMRTLEAIKLLGLNSWIIYCKLSEECLTPESWESLFTYNGVESRKSIKYVLLPYDRLSEDSGMELDDRELISSKRRKKNRKKTRKKRRSNSDQNDGIENELLDLDTSNSGPGLQARAACWLLSTDGFLASWTSVDLPEHLSKHCLSTWMKWIVGKWSDGA